MWFFLANLVGVLAVGFWWLVEFVQAAFSHVSYWWVDVSPRLFLPWLGWFFFSLVFLARAKGVRYRWGFTVFVGVVMLVVVALAAEQGLDNLLSILPYQ